MAAAAMGALVTPADAAPAVEEEKFFFEGVEYVLRGWGEWVGAWW